MESRKMVHRKWFFHLREEIEQALREMLKKASVLLLLELEEQESAWSNGSGKPNLGNGPFSAKELSLWIYCMGFLSFRN